MFHCMCHHTVYTHSVMGYTVYTVMKTGEQVFSYWEKVNRGPKCKLKEAKNRIWDLSSLFHIPKKTRKRKKNTLYSSTYCTIWAIYGSSLPPSPSTAPHPQPESHTMKHVKVDGSICLKDGCHCLHSQVFRYNMMSFTPVIKPAWPILHHHQWLTWLEE